MSSTMLALVDCDSFYCSCERLFNLKARKAPVVVLSNNDGCVVSRSKEAKALGIPMGVPFFKIKHLIKEKGLMAFSSNYALYGDLSSRVMKTLSGYSSEIEFYSIDEAFLDLKPLAIEDYLSYGKKIKEGVYQNVGIPVSIGIAPTKVLTKLASSLAKKSEGVFVVGENKDSLLKTFPIDEIWGIGKASAAKLKSRGIQTAYELMSAEEKDIEKLLSVTGKRIVYELRGISSLEFELEREKRQQILSSKSFERTLFDKASLKEAVSNHALKVTEKLRKEGLHSYGVGVFIHTHRMNEVLPYYNSEICSFERGTDNYQEVLKRALVLLEKIFRPGFEYKKCGVFLFDLREKKEVQLGLFDMGPKDSGPMDNISKTIDAINERFGAHTLSFLSCGNSTPWESGFHRKSPSYTTKWEELIRVF